MEAGSVNSAIVWLPLVSAFVGAIVGASGAVATVWLQSRAETRRHRQKLAVELGLAECRLQMEAVKGSGRPAVFPPVSTYVLLQYRMLIELESGKLTPARYRELVDEAAEFDAVVSQRVDSGR